jgi:Fe-S cluster biosynthesis and repair protein YggX
MARRSLLLSMPAEIRNAIYEQVVRSAWGSTSQDFFVLDRPLPALFNANKQIRSEALDCFLLKNHFHVYTSEIGKKWLDILGKDVNRFRSLTLFIDLQLEAWAEYAKRLLPLLSDQVELRVRKAAASLSDTRFENFLKGAGLYNKDRWTSEWDSEYEVIFKRTQA